MMTKHRGLNFLRVLDGKDAMHGTQLATITHLSAGLGVKRRVIQHHHAHLAFVECIHRHAILVECQDIAVALHEFIAVEVRRRAVVIQIGGHLELARRACLLFLPRHGGIKGRRIHADAMFAADVGGQIKREAIGIVQLEGRLAVEDTALGQRFQLALQNRHAMLNGLKKALFFLLQGRHNAHLMLHQLRKGHAHFGH